MSHHIPCRYPKYFFVRANGQKSKTIDHTGFIDTYGNQESVAYNSHYGTIGYHPLVAFDGVTGDFLKANLRPGNVYTSKGVVEFIQPLIEHSNEKFPETSLFVRGDSGFAVPALYDLCEKESVYYVIRLKSNATLQPAFP
ncbi:hypothetical protein UB32_00780 [Mesobacillus subterraneus]|uniref:Transposase DDE domain-containing protein n=1 Tax=Mesobacillus subterraneus TaxID=285983 RepID=A0A0D6ZEZ2_9BACI|nr:hypothetical protein UB32_00780 [Mesobacillus subterraneus]